MMKLPENQRDIELLSDEWELDPNAILMQNLLGTGNFGEVYKAVYGEPLSVPGCTSQELMSPVAVKLLQGLPSLIKQDVLL